MDSLSSDYLLPSGCVLFRRVAIIPTSQFTVFGEAGGSSLQLTVHDRVSVHDSADVLASVDVLNNVTLFDCVSMLDNVSVVDVHGSVNVSVGIIRCLIVLGNVMFCHSLTVSGDWNGHGRPSVTVLENKTYLTMS